MLIVALTGGIATGKSVVARILEELGCYIQNSDKIAHKLMAPEKPVWEKIVSHFGKEILNPDRTISRLKLGAIVFSSKEERTFLNRLIHPLVLEEKKKTISRLEKEGRYKIFVSEAALTIESGFTQFFDRIIVVFCRKEIQIKRLMERNAISREEALKKIESQMDNRKKIKLADYVIDTSIDLNHTVEQTEVVFRNLMSDYEMKHGIQNP